MKKTGILIAAVILIFLAGCQVVAPAATVIPSQTATAELTPSPEITEAPTQEALGMIGHFDFSAAVFNDAAKQFFGSNFSSIFSAMEPLAAAVSFYSIETGGAFESAEDPETLWGILLMLANGAPESYACYTDAEELALTADAVKLLMYSVTGNTYSVIPECPDTLFAFREQQSVRPAGSWPCAEDEDIYVAAAVDLARYLLNVTKVSSENSEIVLDVEITDTLHEDVETEEPIATVVARIRARFKINVESRFMFTSCGVSGEFYG